MTYVSNSIPRVFGDGLLGTAVTGLIRIPAIMSNCVAVLMVGELAIRGLSETISFFGFQPKDDSWLTKTAKNINESGVRPFKDMPAKELTIKAIAFAALGVVGSEFVRVTGGRAPGVYNNVLSFLGPLRLNSNPYLDNITPFLSRAWSFIPAR